MALTMSHSDHKLITSVRYATIVKIGQQFIKKRSYKLFDPERFISEVQNIRWWNVYSSMDVDEAVSAFTNNITSILNRQDMAPMRVFQSQINYASWLSDETKLVMQERDRATELYNSTRLPAIILSHQAKRVYLTRFIKNPLHAASLLWLP